MHCFAELVFCLQPYSAHSPQISFKTIKSINQNRKSVWNQTSKSSKPSLWKPSLKPNFNGCATACEKIDPVQLNKNQYLHNIKPRNVKPAGLSDSSEWLRERMWISYHKYHIQIFLEDFMLLSFVLSAFMSNKYAHYKYLIKSTLIVIFVMKHLLKLYGN